MEKIIGEDYILYLDPVIGRRNIEGYHAFVEYNGNTNYIGKRRANDKEELFDEAKKYVEKIKSGKIEKMDVTDWK